MLPTLLSALKLRHQCPFTCPAHTGWWLRMCVQRATGSPPSRLPDWAGWATSGWWGTPPRGEPAGWPHVTGGCWWHFENFFEGSVWEKEKIVWNKWNKQIKIMWVFLYHWFFFINWKTTSKFSKIALTALHASFSVFQTSDTSSTSFSSPSGESVKRQKILRAFY